MDQKDKRFNWKLLLLLVLINLFCLFYKTDVLIVQIIKFILPFASCAFLGLQGRTRGMKPKDIAFSFIKIMLRNH